MGFIRKLLGLEQNPGEPVPLTDKGLDTALQEKGITVFIYCFNLWCSSCQVMSGLLNELGPQYLGRARFYKLDINKNPDSAARLNISGVPTIVAFRDKEMKGSHTGLIPLNPLKEWIEENLGQA